MNRLLTIVLILALVFIVYRNINSPIPVSVIDTMIIRSGVTDSPIDQNARIDQCFSKTKCIFIYVAPWCPACHLFLKQYPNIKDHLAKKNIGTLIVVGADEDRQKEILLRNQFPEDAILDSIHADFRKTNQINAFPTFIVTHSNGQVEAFGASAVALLNILLKN